CVGRAVGGRRDRLLLRGEPAFVLPQRGLALAQRRGLFSHLPFENVFAYLERPLGQLFHAGQLQMRIDSCAQFTRVEGFDQVVIGAVLEAFDSGLLARAREAAIPLASPTKQAVLQPSATSPSIRPPRNLRNRVSRGIV